MDDAYISDALTGRIAREFQKQTPVGDVVGAGAFFFFLEEATSRQLTEKQIDDFIYDAPEVKQFIAGFRTRIAKQDASSAETYIRASENHLIELKDSMQQSLVGQQQIQGIVQSLSDVIKSVDAATKRNEKVSKELAGNVSKLLSNTATQTAFILGLLVSTVTNLGTDYVFDRYWSLDAINRRHHPDDVPALTLPELVPPPPPNGNDIMTWFRQNDIYVFTPTPAQTPQVVKPPTREAKLSSAKHRPPRHQR